MIVASFLEYVLYLHSFRQLGESQNFFLGVLGLDCCQLKILLLPKRHFGVVAFAPLHNNSNSIQCTSNYTISIFSFYSSSWFYWSFSQKRELLWNCLQFILKMHRVVFQFHGEIKIVTLKSALWPDDHMWIFRFHICLLKFKGPKKSFLRLV